MEENTLINVVDEEVIVEVVELGDVDLLEEDLVPFSPFCTGCDCFC